MEYSTPGIWESQATEQPQVPEERVERGQQMCQLRLKSSPCPGQVVNILHSQTQYENSPKELAIYCMYMVCIWNWAGREGRETGTGQD